MARGYVGNRVLEDQAEKPFVNRRLYARRSLRVAAVGCSMGVNMLWTPELRIQYEAPFFKIKRMGFEAKEKLQSRYGMPVTNHWRVYCRFDISIHALVDVRSPACFCCLFFALDPPSK